MTGFDPSYAGIGELLKSPEMVAAMVAKAELVKAEAEATAPFDAKAKDGTHYRDAFAVSARRDGGYEHDRAEAIISNDDAAALWVELGSKHNPAHHTLGRALDAAGRDT